ncbi:MAG: ABC transporter substrate-binding protein [Cyclobacteriaceae bacterium]|jgi:ABC-type Fe3+-hydroxamate transport system substrate-binding protein|nr:ABC transporter substrate-binding protein [Cyclobacteriaceae bacterium]
MSTLQKTVIDQLGNEVKFNYPPQRIISLVPSQTELLYDLELEERVVGITKFCERPSRWHQTKTKVGGTKKLQLKTIEALEPDLIIGNKEENEKESIEILQLKYPVWMSDIVTLDDALWMINGVGELTGSLEKSRAINNKITQAFAKVKKHKASVLYLIWRNPWMGAGKGTFIDAMLDQMGLTNVLTTSRYPELSAEQIQVLNPDHVFFSSEPYPFQENHIFELKDIIPHSKLTLVDGQFFSWYGSRLIGAPGYFNTLF